MTSGNFIRPAKAPVLERWITATESLSLQEHKIRTPLQSNDSTPSVPLPGAVLTGKQEHCLCCDFIPVFTVNI